MSDSMSSIVSAALEHQGLTVCPRGNTWSLTCRSTGRRVAAASPGRAQAGTYCVEILHFYSIILMAMPKAVYFS